MRVVVCLCISPDNWDWVQLTPESHLWIEQVQKMDDHLFELKAESVQWSVTRVTSRLVCSCANLWLICSFASLSVGL